MLRQESTIPKVAIVAIHGVGDRKPGDVLDGVMRGLSQEAQVDGTPDWKYYGGQGYRHSKVRGHPIVGSIVEVNWDDLSHPPRRWFEYVTHFASIVASTLRLAVDPIEGDGRRSRWASAYRWVFNALLIWCIYLPIVTIAGFASSRISQLAWIAATVGIVALLARLFSRYDKLFRAGYAWAAAVALVGIASICGTEARDTALALATATYSLVQGLAGVLLAAAMAAVWICDRAARRDQRLARLALLYLPFAIISGVGAIVWAAALKVGDATVTVDLRQWSSAYLAKLTYDLAFSEFLLAAGVALGGCLLLLPAYALIRDDRSGARVHDRLLTALKYFALIVVAIFVLYFVHLPLFLERGQYAAFNAWIRPWLWAPYSGSDPDVFAIYLASSSRLLPFLVYFVGPFRVVLDTVCDVVLYADPQGRLGGDEIRKGTQNRLRDALSLLSGTDNRAVVVVAHSQGSAIAADVLSARHFEDGIRLVTAGSPISSLYWRFIGESSIAAPSVQSLNVFRSGDYISGGVGIRATWAAPSDVLDDSLGPGRHTEYFEDPKLWAAVAVWLAANPKLPVSSPQTGPG